MLIQHEKKGFCNFIADSTPIEVNRIRPIMCSVVLYNLFIIFLLLWYYIIRFMVAFFDY